MSADSFIFPQEVYRWLVVGDILPNRGQLNERQNVVLSSDLNPSLQNGITVGQIIELIFSRKNIRSPDTLRSLKNESSKAAKQANWNLIWISFDDLQMQFDLRIKDLILQGEHALICEIIKQLYDHDDKKDEERMREVNILPKPQSKLLNESKVKAKSTGLDLKKMNTSKDPSEAQSSLQFLLLLLTSSFNMSAEQVLGLFTNQNKYLAHLVVKGVNDDFTGVAIFYRMLLKHIQKLKKFCGGEKRDAQSCLYAVKPGLISKSEEVAQLTIEVFSQLRYTYDWFISQGGRGSSTLLLGVKRHPQLLESYWQLLTHIVQGNEEQYFSLHYKNSFKDTPQLVQITGLLLQYLGTAFFFPTLLQAGVVQEWIQFAINLYQGDINCKLLVFSFFGKFVLFTNPTKDHYEVIDQILRQGWKQKTLIQFIALFNQVLDLLVELASNKNPFARKLYQILIDIFEGTKQQCQKHQYLVRNFLEALPLFPHIPTQYLIEQSECLQSYDYVLVSEAIARHNDTDSLTHIGEALVRLFQGAPVLHNSLAPFILAVAKKSFHLPQGTAFTKTTIKQLLSGYAQQEVTRKIPQLAKQQPMYFQIKGNSEKVSKEDEHVYDLQERELKNVFILIDHLTALACTHPSSAQQIKFQLMEANAFIRRNNFKVQSKLITSLLSKAFAVTKEDQSAFDEEYRTRHPLTNPPNIEESSSKKRSAALLTSSRYATTMKRDFSQLLQKKRKEEEGKKQQEDKKMRQELLKREKVKKEYDKVNLLRGFGQEAELKEDGFWQKFNKEDRQLEVYPPAVMQARDIQYIECLFKKYHRILRALFLKYTSSMYTTKQSTNFEGNKQRTETLSMVQLIKLLKDYKLMFLTTVSEVQLLLRDLNVKLLNKRQTTDLDFHGFEQFIIQFCAVIYTKNHTLNSLQKNLSHLSHLQLVEDWFHYLKMVCIEKGENVAIFQQPQAVYFNESQLIKQFNRKIEQDPSFILPEGYKKITDKTMRLQARWSGMVEGVGQSYIDVSCILDQILYESAFKLHLLQPLVQREVKTRVKPHVFLNVKPKLLEESKDRAYSSIYERPTVGSAGADKKMPPIKMLEKKTLTLGMKLGLSYVSYKDKLLGEQVAYVIDDMLYAIENNKLTIQKEKILNLAVKKKIEIQEKEKFTQIQREKKRLDRKEELEKIKKELNEKKDKQVEENKEEKEKKQEKILKLKQKQKQEKQKHLQQIKGKIEQKKQKNTLQEKKKKQQQLIKSKSVQKKQTFKDFNAKQLQKFKKLNEDQIQKKKKIMIQQLQQKKNKDDLVKKLRNKIQSSDRRAIEEKQKISQQINQLYSSSVIKNTFERFEGGLRGLFQLIVKNTFLSITQKKHNNEIIEESWLEFGHIFQLIPLIISAREMLRIFKQLSKDKQIIRNYHTGLTFEEFQQALLRIAIKHKSIFNKLSEKIKDNMTNNQIDAVVTEDIQEKEKNQFQEPKQINVKGLMKEEDIDKHFVDHYGDISKVNQKTLQGLIFYLKVPNDKMGQDKRFRQIMQVKINRGANNAILLKQKLSQDYTLQSAKKIKKNMPS